MKTNSFENDPVAQKSHSDSNFKAMQLLKDTELSLQAAHNRIRVLQTQELRNQSKAEQTLTLLQRLQQVREAEQAHLSVVPTTPSRSIPDNCSCSSTGRNRCYVPSTSAPNTRPTGNTARST